YIDTKVDNKMGLILKWMNSQFGYEVLLDNIVTGNTAGTCAANELSSDYTVVPLDKCNPDTSTMYSVDLSRVSMISDTLSAKYDVYVDTNARHINKGTLITIIDVDTDKPVLCVVLNTNKFYNVLTDIFNEMEDILYQSNCNYDQTFEYLPMD